MKKILISLMFFSMSAFAGPTQQSPDPNLAHKASGGQSLPVVGLCDYVHPCVGQAAPVSLRDNTNTPKQKSKSTSPTQTTPVGNAQ